MTASLGAPFLLLALNLLLGNKTGLGGCLTALNIGIALGVAERLGSRRDKSREVSLGEGHSFLIVRYSSL